MRAETLDLARLQFAITAGGHFLFVALTLGLATLVAVVQTGATVTRSPVLERMTRFWGQLYLINYAMGILTGLVMEFQFGLAWSGLTDAAGDVFGGPLALETVVAFFVESTFLGLWIFGWHLLNRWVHLALIWVVTLTAYGSAYFILVANGFLQHPAGHRVLDGHVTLVDAGALFTNPSAVLAFFHVLAGALLTAGFFMAGVSAYHLFRRGGEHTAFFRRSLRIGVFVTPPATLVAAGTGGAQFELLADHQPMKAAVANGQTAEIVRLQAEAVARFGPGEYVPPEAWVQAGGVLMLAAFGLMFLLSWPNALLAAIRPAVERLRPWHLLLMLLMPLPYVAMIGGWVFREMGRQPWVINGVLRTEDAVSDISPGAMRLSLIAFTVVFALLVAADAWLLARFARRGPDAVALGDPDSGPGPEPGTGTGTEPAGRLDPLPAARF